MPDTEKPATSSDPDLASSPSTGPLVFLSHDTRDADLAEALSKLLKSVSAGMVKTFRSSDKKGTEGIAFGDEWYKRLMAKLQATSDVVCLFTERSLDRPWILFEAGVAKGKLNAPVIGLALGIPLGRVGTGPFYNFHNMDDSEESLTKLVHQLAQRVPTCELDPDVVKVQVAAFKATEANVLKALNAEGKAGGAGEPDDSPLARLAEELKAMPSRVAERLAESGEPLRRRRMRHFHPMMFEEIMHMSGDPGDPVGILMAASVIRDDAPWLYELAMEVYRAVKSGDPGVIEQEMARLQRFAEFTMRGPFMEEFGIGGRESHMFLMEFPRMLERMLGRTLEGKKGHVRRRSPRPHSDQS